MKKIIIILLLIPVICFSQVYVRSADVMYFDEGWVNLAQYFTNGIIPKDADITDELQEAINTGNNVIIPFTINGTDPISNYWISSTVSITRNGQIIQGAGLEFIRIRPTSDMANDTMIIIDADYITLKDLCFMGGNNCSFGLYCKNVLYSTFQNLYVGFFSNSGNDTAYGVYLDYSFSNRFFGCDIYSNEVGVFARIGNAVSMFGTICHNNSITDYLIHSSNQFNIFGGNVECSDGGSLHHLIVKNSRVNLYGCYIEKSAISDILVIGNNTTASYINVYGGWLNKIELDSSAGIVFLDLYGTTIDSYTDTVFSINFNKIGSVYSKVNLNDVKWFRSGINYGANLNIRNFTSDMHTGITETLIDFLKLYPYNINEKMYIKELIVDSLKTN